MKHKKSSSVRIKSFSLNELLIVLAIIGILVMLALPRLMPLISKAKSTEAKLQLEHVYTLEKAYFMVNSKYSANLTDIDFEHETLSTDGGSANYRIEIVDAGQKNFLVRATAIVDFDGDGSINVWEIDQDKKLIEVTKD